MLDFRLSASHIRLRQKARDFALKDVLPVAWHYDNQNEMPLQVLQKAFKAGLMNGEVPKRFGGKGLGMLESVLVTEEIAAACPGLATSIFDNSLGLEPILLCENDVAKEKYLPDIVRNFRLICFATSEPTMGSDVAGIRCLATPDGEGYRLSGTKFWVTNGGVADFMTVFATIDPQRRHEGICAFVVEKQWAGVSVGRHIPKLGQRNSNTTALHFENVRVPKENVLAAPGRGFVLAMKTFARTRPVIGAFAVGAARSAMEYAIDYARKRKTFGTPIANNQAIQFKFAEMYQRVETARLLTWKAAWEADQGLDPTIAASLAKFYATEAALKVVNDALQVLGGYGYTRMFPLEKLLRDTRLLTIYEGTSEIQRMIVSGHVLNVYTPVMPPLEDLPTAFAAYPPETPAVAVDGPLWRCRMCGYLHAGDVPPESCPLCFFPKTAFKAVAP
jgi:acyl-CoA dehydrogenase